uniref:Uncharacterized protein n=1 Tax=Parascaris equorum TaxID=6256 RepID=A0A914RKE6_PAREQ
MATSDPGFEAVAAAYLKNVFFEATVLQVGPLQCAFQKNQHATM